MAARTLVEQEPDYAYVSARLLLDKLRTEVLSFVLGAPTSASQADMAVRYGEYFPAYIKTGIKAELLDPIWRVRPEEARRGAEAGARSGVSVSGAANAVRPLFPA
jgi:hypothetical protein